MTELGGMLEDKLVTLKRIKAVEDVGRYRAWLYDVAVEAMKLMEVDSHNHKFIEWYMYDLNQEIYDSIRSINLDYKGTNQIGIVYYDNFDPTITAENRFKSRGYKGYDALVEK